MVVLVFVRVLVFYIVDVDENGNIVSEKVIQNSVVMVGGGVGLMVVQIFINEGVEVIIVFQVGLNVFGVIQVVGIRFYQVVLGILVEEVIKSVVSGEVVQFMVFVLQVFVVLVVFVILVVLVLLVYGLVYLVYFVYGYGFGFGWGRGWGCGWGRGCGFGRGWGRGGRGWGVRFGYCLWIGMFSRRIFCWYYGWW